MDSSIIEYKKRIREFISKYMESDAFGDDEDLFKTGYVNSLFAMELVTFAEKYFQIMIEDDELNMDNFRSVDAIASLVSRKLTPEKNE